MKALIFNSGLGSRLGELTVDRPKSMVELPGGETIFHRQLRVLSSCGIREFVITTGPFPEMLETCATEFEAEGCEFSFVHNDRYPKTNYIWSMWLARDLIRDDDILMLHGDLVFDAGYVRRLISAPTGSWGSVNRELPPPEKDFKARITDGEIREVGVGISGDDCHAFQAMYRLTAQAVDTWLASVADFVKRDDTGVYAENAANEVFDAMHVHEQTYAGHVLDEVDTPEDLIRVGAAIRERDWTDQPVLELRKHELAYLSGDMGSVARASDVTSLIRALGMSHPLIIADSFLSDSLDNIFGGAFSRLPVFSDYAPNPTYEQVLAGIYSFRNLDCDGLVSVGGGSATDVAKCIRLWELLPGDGVSECFADMNLIHPRYPHLAIPTTAGTGSESTHFAVVYVDGLKRSIAHSAAQPSAALLAPTLLAGLPSYQRASTLMDALCQAIESHWSKGSSELSRKYTSQAIPMIASHARGYLQGDNPDSDRHMAIAANLAGKAINLTTTTAPHAMSYKLSSLFGYAHGHAVSLCMMPCWRELLTSGDSVIQKRLTEIAKLLTANADAVPQDGLESFEKLFIETGLKRPSLLDNATLDLLTSSVNKQRLANFPLELDSERVACLYKELPKT